MGLPIVKASRAKLFDQFHQHILIRPPILRIALVFYFLRADIQHTCQEDDVFHQRANFFTRSMDFRKGLQFCAIPDIVSYRNSFVFQLIAATEQLCQRPAKRRRGANQLGELLCLYTSKHLTHIGSRLEYEYRISYTIQSVLLLCHHCTCHDFTPPDLKIPIYNADYYISRSELSIFNTLPSGSPNTHLNIRRGERGG